LERKKGEEEERRKGMRERKRRGRGEYRSEVYKGREEYKIEYV
jgi:hypothetical protein